MQEIMEEDYRWNKKEILWLFMKKTAEFLLRKGKRIGRVCLCLNTIDNGLDAFFIVKYVRW